MIKKIIIIILILFSIAIFAYGGIGFYVAYSILKIDPTCGWHQNSLPNTWSTKVDSHEYSNFSRSRLRENFPSSKYHLEDWQDVYFSSREDDIMLNGWLFNYFPNRPIVIVVHGLFSLNLHCLN